MLRSLASMPKWLKVSIAVVCVLSLIYIAWAPDLDLPDTILRAVQTAIMLFVLLELLAFAGATLAVFSRDPGPEYRCFAARVLALSRRTCDLHVRTC